MKTLKLLTLIALFIGFSSCSSDDDEISLMQIESESISNLFAPQQGGQGQPITGEFTKFDFSSGTITASETNWDIAFRGTDIIVNGGVNSGATDEPNRTGNAAAYIATNTLAGVNKVQETLFQQDSANGYVLSNWYTYTGPPNHLILPTAGKVLVVKTRDGKYAKLEILSYYKNAPEEITLEIATNDARYFTFNYVYQPNDGVDTF